MFNKLCVHEQLEFVFQFQFLLTFTINSRDTRILIKVMSQTNDQVTPVQLTLPWKPLDSIFLSLKHHSLCGK